MTKKHEEEVAVANLPAVAHYTDDDFDEQYAGAGQTTDAKILITPFVVTLQANSPQCKPVRHGGIEGAASGRMFNMASSFVYPTGDDQPGFGFQAAGSTEKFVKFHPRRDDGTSDGFISVHDPDDREVVEAMRDPYGTGKAWTGFGKLPAFTEDNGPAELIQTFTLFGFAVLDWDDISTVSRVAIPFTSTKIMAYRRFATMSADIKYPFQNRPGFYQPAIFQQRWRINTMLRTKGSNSWYVPTITYWGEDARTSFIRKADPFFEAGRVFFEMITKGEVTAQYEETQADHASTESGDDVPF